MADTQHDVEFTQREWNASGSVHCYTTKPIMSLVVEILTTEGIRGDLLQQATDRALARMPYFSQTIVLGEDGLYYYADNPLPLIVAERQSTRALGTPEANYHMVDVTYHENKISFSVFHGLTDGLGLNRLIEAVLYHYFCLKDGMAYGAEGIYTDAVPYDPAEVEDPVARSYDFDPKDLIKLAPRNDARFRIPELDEEGNTGSLAHRLPLRMRIDDLISWCKGHGASPAPALAAFLAKAVAREHPEMVDNVVALVPIDRRRALGTEKSFKNCAGAVALFVRADDALAASAGDVATRLRQDMRAQLCDDLVVLGMVGYQMLCQRGKGAPTYEEKRQVFGVAESYPMDTFTVDYVGGLVTGGYEDQISEVRYLNPVAHEGQLGILMSATGGYFHLSINQSFESDRYYRAFCSVLDDEGIAYERLTRGTYLNPGVELTL